MLRSTGLPVRVGIAPSKTLAKVAILGAKQNLTLGGVCHIGSYPATQFDEILAALPVTELWGVAGRTGKKHSAMGIYSAKDLWNADARQIRKSFSVVLARTVYELRGISCIPLEEEREYKDQLIFSRSFAKPVTTAEEMQQVLSIYAQNVSTRLRKGGQVARSVTAWAQTSHHGQNEWHSAQVSVGLDTHTSEPIRIGKATNALLPKLKPGARYARAGVALTDLTPESSLAPLDLFVPEFEGTGIGDTLDKINTKLGGHLVGVGRGGMKKAPAWNMKREMLSNRGTTHWDELLQVKAG